MSRSRFSILPLDRATSGVLPWVIGIMVYLTALSIIGGSTLVSATHQWTGSLNRTWTVQLVEPDAGLRAAQTNALMNLLETMPGVISVQPLSEAKSRALLEPWLGEGAKATDLPIPVLIDVQLSADAQLDAKRVGQQLRDLAGGATLDDHGAWGAQLAIFARGLQVLALAIVVLVALAMVAVVTFNTRAGLAGHRNAFEVLHFMGAEDSQLAREFQRRYWIQGMLGGLGGVAAALITAYGLGWCVQHLAGGLLGALTLGPITWSVLAGLPLATAFLTMIAARVTVHRALAEFV